jgi:hypothetical protein
LKAWSPTEEELVVFEGDAGAGVGWVGVGGGLAEVEEGTGEVERVVGEGVFEEEEREEVSCAKDELGRIHERKRRVEERGRVDRGQWQMCLERRDSIFPIQVQKKL